MNDFIYRLLLSAFALMLFYGIYCLLLKRFTLLNASRFYLNSTMVIALLTLLPWQKLIESPAEFTIAINLDLTTIFPDTYEIPDSTGFNWWKLVWHAYLIPVIVLLGFFLYSNLRMMLLISRAEKFSLRNTKIALFNNDILPFSWFGIIVISRKDYQSHYVESIIAHELTHIHQNHFIDLILSEVLIVLQWFNPIAWSYRYALRNVHEYLADKGTIHSGFKITDYQRLLAALAGPVTAGILSNNIKHSILKNRFIMMTKTNNRKLTKLRLITALFAAMLIGFGVFITACQMGGKKTESTDREIKEIPEELIEVTAQESPDVQYDITYEATPDESDEVFIVVENPPTFPGGDDARIKYLLDNITYPQQAREKGIQGNVFVTFVIEKDGLVTDVKILRGIGGGCDEEAMRVIKNMPKWIPGKQRGKTVRVQFNMPIRFTLE